MRLRTGERVAAPERAARLELVAWSAAVPAGAIGALAVLVLGPAVGRALLGPGGVSLWSSFAFEVRPEPVEQGRYLVALAAPALLLAAIVVAACSRAWRAARWVAPAALLVQLAGIAFAALCVVQQQEHVLGPLYPAGETVARSIRFFSDRALAGAALGTVALVALARVPRVRATLAPLARETRPRAAAAAALAVAATAVWLLHALYTERTIAQAYQEVVYHLEFTLDETFAVLNGRSPLVDYAAQYGSLLPYAYAAGMAALGKTVGVWIALAVATTGAGMLAVFAALRRAARSSLVGLLLFLPVLAASFYRIGGTLEDRYTYGDYFGTFPLRYAGPSLLVWLVARQLDGAAPRRRWPLFAAAGLVALNNVDAGLPALGATAVALLIGGGPLTRAALRRTALEALVGLAAAYALVAALTLVRAHALPDLGLLLRFSHIFATGFGMVPMPAIGLHLAIFLTYVAAIGVAGVRAVRGAANRTLTGLLAWSAVFGLGAGAYFVGRSTTDDLPAMFFPWTLTLALLLVPALRGLAFAPWRRVSPAAVASVFAFATMACFLAQTPRPGEQLRRFDHPTPPILAAPLGQAFVARHVHRGERVAILVLFGHKIAYDLGVEDVAPYSNSLAMPAVEQLQETVDVLRRAGGGKIFMRPEYTSVEMEGFLGSRGFERTGEDAAATTTLWTDARAR